jgi:uncharacterized membrane protein
MVNPAQRSGSSAQAVKLFYRLLIPVALTCFVATIFTDWAYTASATIQFSNMSAWLLLAGLVAAGLAIALLGLSAMDGWLDRTRLLFAGAMFLTGFVVEVINFMIHSRDGWTTVVPTGLMLSIVGALLFLTAAWVARTSVVIDERRD